MDQPWSRYPGATSVMQQHMSSREDCAVVLPVPHSYSEDAQAAQEMDRMLAVFLRFASHLRDQLAGQGFWSNAVDPRTGTALFDAQGAPWSEVTAARSLLRYPTRDAAACLVVVHPEYGEA